MKIRTLLAPIVAAALVLSACSVDSGSDGDGPSGDAVIPVSGTVAEVSQLVHDSMEGIQVGWVPTGMGIPLTENWNTQLKIGLEQLGAELIMRDPNWDNSKMPDIVDGLINADVDVLVLHNPDVGVLTSQIQRAKDEGIYVITLNMMPSQQSDAFVGGDFQAMGAALADRVVQDCSASGKTKIATIDGFSTDGSSVAARAGWNSVFEGSDLEVVSEQSANYLPAEANQVATTLLQQHPDLCAIVGNFDTMMLGASQAVGQAGKTGEVGVYSLDASAPACENIKNGTLTATISYSVPAMGGTVVGLIESMIQSGATPGETRSAIFMPFQMIDASNVDDVALACYGNQ
ncbi:MAG: sugar ABC transporter substrate-binding protein [Aeromicrobium sp.]|uniref:sugar ABC transporter substrate-binding protein n=1 Tax=Aeromicrobium sp. TaxID=1871063 RepID=UPI00262865B8|nr:sugar ABC transporter substrate-binding protein [Aeromicrobium sp.]MDF1705937.1 sugar ABC transporter substrate-binding protein [Aeromicrobium sp.]